MATGILIVTQPGIGQALVGAAEGVLGRLPLQCGTFEVPHGTDPDTLLPAASAAMRRVDGGDGVLVLIDMHGSAAARVASKLAHLGTPVRRVAGASLPMLLRVLDYADKPLDELPAIAAAGARNGVILEDG
ncbi:PTS sugar transporter subunit IIA [Luteimonas dalianensis]|uniref:PTS sugar transporter subunit IIA n=1 Tax=Luteimonas dalianensis TaxID=1148196 RepID=UPI003BF3A610